MTILQIFMQILLLSSSSIIKQFTAGQIITSPLFGTLIGSTIKSAWTSKTIYQFLGVKYAEAPSGKLRFKKPVLAIPWPGVHNVEQLKRACPYIEYIRQMPVERLSENLEDCLNLNIYTTNTTANNPVMVFVHGGRFEAISPNTFQSINLLERDIVLVTVKYRLGALGFLSTESPEIPGNFALDDVIAALKWIQLCIRHFGGDPTRVTLIGHSSGAAMVSAIVFNPATTADNLFQRTIIMSGTTFAHWSFDEQPLRQARNIASFTNCTRTETIAELNECFQNIPVIPLLEAYEANYRNIVKKCDIPCGGSKIVLSDTYPLHPFSILHNSSSFKNIPMMIGVAKHDSKAVFGTELYDRLMNNFGLDNSTFNTHQLIDFIFSYNGINDYTGTLKGLMSNSMFNQEQILEGNFYNMLSGLVDTYNIIFMKAPIFKSVRAQANLYPNKTYLYAIDYRGEHTYANIYQYRDEKFADGVQHGDELMYLFAHPLYAQNLNDDDKKFAGTLIDLVTSFARTGIPESNSSPKWPPMTEFAGPYLHIDKENWIGENFLDELSVVSREDHCSGSAASKNNVTVLLWLGLSLIIINLLT